MTPLLGQPQSSNFFLKIHLCFLGILLPVNPEESTHVYKTSFQNEISPESRLFSSTEDLNLLCFTAVCLQGDKATQAGCYA